MGCCLSRDQSSLADSEELEGGMTLGKSRPLLQERLKWKSDVPITEGQLRSKRDEFWETAPAFEGRKEIWDALKAASAQAETGDWAMAQAILEGASVVLPDGTLRESYDELGNRYQVPIYCLFSPINLVESKSESSIASNGAPDPLPVSASPPSGGKPVTLKLRLSNSAEGTKDLSMDVRSTEQVASVKRRLIALHPAALPSDPHDQRWYYGGRYLRDKATVEECAIPGGFVVQVIIRSLDDCPVISTSAAPRKGKDPRKKRKSKDKTPKSAASKPESSPAEPGKSDHPAAASSLNPSPPRSPPPETEGKVEKKPRPNTKESGSSMQLSSLSSSSTSQKEPTPVE